MNRHGADYGLLRMSYLQASSLLEQESIVLLLLECLDLLGIVHLSQALMHDIAQQHFAVKRFGPVCVIVQHLVGRVYLLAPQLCPFFCISLINLQQSNTVNLLLAVFHALSYLHVTYDVLLLMYRAFSV